MIYIVTNIYNNNGVYNIELRNQELEQVYIKSNTKELEIGYGDFVEVEKKSGKNMIKEVVSTPENYLAYYKAGNFSYNELYAKFEEYYNEIEDDEFKIILDNTIFKNLQFFKYPAAKAIHHAYIGGLAEHTLNMLELAQGMIKKYNLDLDLLYMGIILHDYSKICEMEHYGLNYTTEGNLVGHLIMTIEEIVEICVENNIENSLKIIALKHLILSHHGKLEYGSAKEPMIKEAYILSQLDEIDAKMNILENSLTQVEENIISNPIKNFDYRRFLNYKKD